MPYPSTASSCGTGNSMHSWPHLLSRCTQHSSTSYTIWTHLTLCTTEQTLEQILWQSNDAGCMVHITTHSRSYCCHALQAKLPPQTFFIMAKIRMQGTIQAQMFSLLTASSNSGLLSLLNCRTHKDQPIPILTLIHSSLESTNTQ